MVALCLSPRSLFQIQVIAFTFSLIHLSSFNCEKTLPDWKNSEIYEKERLALFDGSNPDLPILMAVKGVVFDVSSGRRFYGKGASYNALVGKDSSRAVAKMSLEENDLNDNLDGLSKQELKSLDDTFTETYLAKYPIVGYTQDFVKTQKMEL